jgi:hypothetical protein
MPKTSARNAIFVINGYVFSTFATAYEAVADAGKVDVTGFSDGGQNFIPGLPSANMKANMLWDSTLTTGIHAVMASRPSGVVTLLPEGGALGAPTISMPFMQGNYNPKGSPSSALEIGSIDFAAFGPNVGLEYGWALQHGIISNTLTGTGYDDPLGAAVTAASVGTLHIWTPCAADTYVVKIQHSTLIGSGYVDLVTFVANGAARTVERIVVASGTINRYRRVLATRTGAANNPFGFTVHFAHS